MTAIDTAKRIAEQISGADDLYTALREAAPGTLEPAEALLPGVIAAADPATAARLRAVDNGLLRAVLRRGQGGPAIAHAAALRARLAGAAVAPLFLPPLEESESLALPTNGEHPDMPAFSDRAFDGWFAARAVPYGLGAYGEVRSVYATAQFADAASPERRTVHLGIDVFAPAMTPVHAPLPGRVRHVTYNADPLDYGHTLILEHDAGGLPFFTLYGHLAATLPGLCQPGATVAAGQVIAHLGDWHENGGWAPHIHFQVMSDLLEQHSGNFFGVGHKGLWDVWQDICLDPNLILRLPAFRFSLR